MRMVACDLDGTIVCALGGISARTLAVLRECEQAGVRIVFATGRPPRWMPPIAAQTGHRGVALCSNGAVVIDLPTNAVVQSSGLASDVVVQVAQRLRERLPGAAFALETLSGFRHEPGYHPHLWEGVQAARGPLAELLADEPIVIKLLCRQAGGHEASISADGMLALAREALGGLAEAVHSNPADFLLEISALGVSKASALAALAAESGIRAADVVAFGDMPNDAPMLAWAGVGYAMADGHPEAIAAASGLAPPCAEDGVAQVLERLLADLRR